MPDLGELTRLYQCALEERRIREDRYEEDRDHINGEVIQARADMERAWLRLVVASDA